MKVLKYLFFKSNVEGPQEPYDEMNLMDVETPRQGEQIILICDNCDSLHYYDIVSIARRYENDDESDSTLELVFVHLMPAEDEKDHDGSHSIFSLN